MLQKTLAGEPPRRKKQKSRPDPQTCRLDPQTCGYVTDKDAKRYEHIEYFPFGETWVQDAGATWRTQYLYTSKELDEETQLYYFGARYYDPRTSVWQSADPILGEYLRGKRGLGGIYTSPNLGLYSYGHQNPVRYVDPDGNSIFSAADWVDFGRDVGGLLVDEIVYTAAIIAGNEAVASLAIQGMVEKRGDAAASTVGIVSPVPRTGKALKAANSALDSKSTKEFIEEIGKRAERKVGGTGSAPGTKKHKYAEKLLERYQAMTGKRANLEAESSWKEGTRKKYGTEGSTRLDVYDKDTGDVYDYKFTTRPGSGMTKAQEAKIRREGPDNVRDVIPVEIKAGQFD